jgi:hypothetical protein
MYSRFFYKPAADRSTTGVDGLLAALEDKRIEVSLHAAAKAQAAQTFKQPTPGKGDGRTEATPTDLARGRTKTSRTRKRRSARRTRHAKTWSPSPRQRIDGVHRRADFCNPASDCMRHRVRRSLREWEKIDASVQNLQWIREGVSIPFKNNRPPPRFSQGASLLDATPTQQEFVNRDLARFVQAGAGDVVSNTL